MKHEYLLSIFDFIAIEWYPNEFLFCYFILSKSQH